eukprot:83179-Chlamydomonas_euryale.AAC.2
MQRRRLVGGGGAAAAQPVLLGGARVRAVPDATVDIHTAHVAARPAPPEPGVVPRGAAAARLPARAVKHAASTGAAAGAAQRVR